MSGFILVPKTWEDTDKFQKAKLAFSNKSVKLVKKEHYLGEKLLVYYEDLFNNTEKWFESESSNFFIYFGVLHFNGQTGKVALQCIEEELNKNKNLKDLDLRGNFLLICYFKGNLLVTQDLFGSYGCYTDDSQNWLSTNFIAAAYLIGKFEFNRQEYLESCLFGIVFGRKTVLKGIDTLEPTLVYEINSKKYFSKSFKIPELIFDREECLEANLSAILDEFHVYFKNFNKISTALSGGFDTRLLLAACRKTGIDPILYVYGDENSLDVRVAKEIASGEGFPLDHFDKTKHVLDENDNPLEFIYRNFWDHDSKGYLFEDNIDTLLRLERAKNSNLLLNGWGGGVYRDFSLLKFKEIRLKNYLRNFYDTGELESFGIEVDQFWENIEDKVFEQIKRFGIPKKTFSRDEAERVFLIHRINFNIGNTILNNYYGNAILPFTSKQVGLTMFSIPYQFKKFGYFEAELIKRLDPKLASYNSEYGFDFLNGPSFNYKLKQSILSNLNPKMKSYLRFILKTSAKSTKSNPFSPNNKFFTKEILGELFNEPEKNPFIDNFQSISNRNHLTRIYSMELLKLTINK
jgi:hypothetical protein